MTDDRDLCPSPWCGKLEGHRGECDSALLDRSHPESADAIRALVARAEAAERERDEALDQMRLIVARAVAAESGTEAAEEALRRAREVLARIVADASSYYFQDGMPAKAARAALEQVASIARAALAAAPEPKP
jgi:hypothetical protein